MTKKEKKGQKNTYFDRLSLISTSQIRFWSPEVFLAKKNSYRR